MINAATNFLNALDVAGYITEDGEYEQVVEFDNVFVFICFNNNEGEYLVGVFHKASATRSGDFEGCPRAEGELSDCRKAFARICNEYA